MTTIAERLRALYATHPVVMEGADALDAAEKALGRASHLLCFGDARENLDLKLEINAALSKLRGAK